MLRATMRDALNYRGRVGHIVKRQIIADLMAPTKSVELADSNRSRFSYEEADHDSERIQLPR